MCHPVRCRVCGKVTWAGCGDHVDQALAGFAQEDLCEGHDGQAPGQPNLMAKLFGR